MTFPTAHKSDTPYAVERRRFLEHCHAQGFAKAYLKQIAGILLTAAIDLQAHGGLGVDPGSLDAAARRHDPVSERASGGVLAPRPRPSGLAGQSVCKNGSNLWPSNAVGSASSPPDSLDRVAQSTMAWY